MVLTHLLVAEEQWQWSLRLLGRGVSGAANPEPSLFLQQCNPQDSTSQCMSLYLADPAFDVKHRSLEARLKMELCKILCGGHGMFLQRESAARIRLCWHASLGQQQLTSWMGGCLSSLRYDRRPLIAIHNVDCLEASTMHLSRILICCVLLAHQLQWHGRPLDGRLSAWLQAGAG